MLLFPSYTDTSVGVRGFTEVSYLVLVPSEVQLEMQFTLNHTNRETESHYIGRYQIEQILHEPCIYSVFEVRGEHVRPANSTLIRTKVKNNKMAENITWMTVTLSVQQVLDNGHQVSPEKIPFTYHISFDKEDLSSEQPPPDVTTPPSNTQSDPMSATPPSTFEPDTSPPTTAPPTTPPPTTPPLVAEISGAVEMIVKESSSNISVQFYALIVLQGIQITISILPPLAFFVWCCVSKKINRKSLKQDKEENIRRNVGFYNERSYPYSLQELNDKIMKGRGDLQPPEEMEDEQL